MTHLRLIALAFVLAACGGGGGGGGDDAPTIDAGTDPDGGGGDDAAPDGASACAAAESCDGVVDDNCDGTVDEGCGRCPLLTVACPAGCCAVDRWEVDTVSAIGASIDVAADGTIYYAYAIPSSSAWQSKLAVYDPGPGTWRAFPLTAGTYRTRVRLDGLGRVHVAYGSSGGPLLYRRSDDRGMTFSAAVTVGTLNIGGLFDLEIDSADQPHLAYAGDAQFTYSSDLRYAHLTGTTWTTEILDPDTGASDFPDLALGFADRPHIVYEAYHPPGSTSTTKRYAFDNGNRWIFENLDVLGSSQTYGDSYFSGHTLRVDATDAREVLFTRTEGSVMTLRLARRGPGDLDTWAVSPVTGATAFGTPALFVDAAGARGAVSDGLRLHREGGTTWASTPIDVLGSKVAVARRGRFLYLAFTGAATDDSGPPTVTVVDLGP